MMQKTALVLLSVTSVLMAPVMVWGIVGFVPSVFVDPNDPAALKLLELLFGNDFSAKSCALSFLLILIGFWTVFLFGGFRQRVLPCLVYAVSLLYVNNYLENKILLKGIKTISILQKKRKKKTEIKTNFSQRLERRCPGLITSLMLCLLWRRFR
jgi:hypothetical protein